MSDQGEERKWQFLESKLELNTYTVYLNDLIYSRYARLNTEDNLNDEVEMSIYEKKWQFHII